jgi:hypothetical protein
MEKYMIDFDFETAQLFGSTNQPMKRKLNFLNMTDAAIEALSEAELKEGLIGRGINVEGQIDKLALIKKAKSL